jgi:hypothetical protein
VTVNDVGLGLSAIGLVVALAGSIILALGGTDSMMPERADGTTRDGVLGPDVRPKCCPGRSCA